MSQYYRILPLLASAVTFVLFEIIYRTPTWIFAVAMVVPILFWVTLYLIFGVHLKTPSTRIKFLITPVLLTWSALALAWQLGYSIAVPLVVLALGGRLLDKKFGTSPWLLVSGVILSLFISTFLVYSKTINILSETEHESETNQKSENKL